VVDHLLHPAGTKAYYKGTIVVQFVDLAAVKAPGRGFLYRYS